MSANADAVFNQDQFKSRHKPGVKVGNDAAPVFLAQTLPADSAPSDQTFTSNTTSEVPGQAMNPNISSETWTNAESTITGATSADVHTGYGHPKAKHQTRQPEMARPEEREKRC
ncbi:MAG: hypothetical protein M1818_000378 [Claussenomyces sp. TS43310]|nr:MAG: hypothetical protein M1818_000378 [Claussenomyces sp. TS43310]